MKERTFRRPSVKEIFNLQGIESPRAITPEKLGEFLAQEKFILAGDSYAQAVETIENLDWSAPGIIILPQKFMISRISSDFGIKSLEDLVKIDNVRVLRNISNLKNPPGVLTKAFLRNYQIIPENLIKLAIEECDVENPPIGFYWTRRDKHFSATTWLRSFTGAEMQAMKSKGDFSGKVLDKVPYGKNLRVRVNSRTEEGIAYEFTLSNLPMHKARDPERFAGWVDIEHNSNDPDVSYRGKEHQKKAFPFFFWSASTIFSFYDAMKYVGKHPHWNQFQINPFPIPVDEKMVDFTDTLRLKCLIVEKSSSEGYWVDVLNKTEIDKLIGARTVLRGYNNCWYHWGKKDLDFLYKPKD